MNICSAAGRYDVTPLPFIPFSNIGGEALNNNGVVVGGIANPDGTVALAQWSRGTLTTLGIPPGLPSQEFNLPRVFGMNDHGAVVGTVHTSGGDIPSRWFIYDRHAFNVLPLAEPTDLGGSAIGINNRGEVVGFDHTSSKRLKAWLWSKGGYSSLPVSGTSTSAFAINSSGTIIGNRKFSVVRRIFAGRFHYAGERGYVLSRGAPRYLNGFVYAINNSDEAAGGSVTNGQAMAAVFKNGITTVILNVPSAAVGINCAASVAGWYQPAGSQRRLFRWSAELGAFDLTPKGYFFAQAAAINDRGDILGFGRTVSGNSQYFLLTPDPNGELTPQALNITPPAGAR
jgi:uncharacterized membrane protein